MKKIKYRKYKIWVAVSPILEGANIYIRPDRPDFYESFEEAIRAGWNKDEVVEATIFYKKEESSKKKGVRI